MTATASPSNAAWALIVPAIGVASLAAASWAASSVLVALVIGVVLVVCVFAAVHHAEIVALRIGEPFGTLVLAVAVTVIEVALIVSIMLEAGEGAESLARDTVFAAVMIVCNGIVGVCLLAGGVRHRIQAFHLQGALAGLAVLAALTVLTLIVPNVTTTTPGPTLNPVQLLFAGFISLILYGAFVFVQTIRHRDFFLPPDVEEDSAHAEAPSARIAWLSFGALLASLVAVVGLAKALSPMLERGLDAVDAPKALMGIVIAALVLLPEGMAAYRAARFDRLQTSMNLALGSALATIGLTVPAVAVVSLILDVPIALGLGPKEIVLLSLTLLVATITLGTGRTTVLQGIVHLSIFAAFVFYTLVP
jgi:Ca2+:H+ antiporter